ncbi:MAG TPA: 3-phosphoshikimate 1-carboxyvinyltransferase [Candidatus Dormibacteraeota bacterium]|jgi:3-phosphoshikimate 1-carboxyvinyltransferase|nr:3-phosphoshikimate 1-carboxyvinyltransferase [Candidatus Dormibacteraeota bacterium]
MLAPTWPAPTAAGPVSGSVSLPGSKSITNRALLIAALASEPSLLRRPLRSRDTQLMSEGLRRLGVTITDEGDDIRVVPVPELRGECAIDVGNAGTVMRFLPAAAALAEGDVAFDGDEAMRRRPLAPLLDGLRQLGVEIDDEGRGAPPLTVRGRGGVPGGAVTIDASESSQLISGLLLAAPRFARGLDLRHVGRPVPSAPLIATTVAMLRAAGAQVSEPEPDHWVVAPGRLRGGEVAIEPDLSNAAPFLAAAMVTGGRVTVEGWPRETTQPGDALRTILADLGGVCELDGAGLTVQGGRAISGRDLDLRPCSELATTIAALATLADTPSRLTGIGHIRGHETDRLAALVREINGLGGDASELEDGIEIRPRPLHGGVFHTYDDHRLATAGAVIGLAVPGVEVENIATTGKTLPNFVDLWTILR